jgi:uncharacterized protein GlcG (DUF336 family)
MSNLLHRGVLLLVLCLGSVLAGEPLTINIDVPIPNDTPALTADEVNTIIGQAVGFLKAKNASGVIAVVDREGHILSIFRMTQSAGADIRINEQATVKARTAAFFQSDENSFTTRTAQFIVQSNFPPGVRNVDAGPLYGVPFSNFAHVLNPLDAAQTVQLQVPPFIVFVPGVNVRVAETGVAPAVQLPPGNTNARPALQPLIITPLTDDLGGLPIYKRVGRDFKAAGGVGIEIDGFGVLQDGKPDDGVKRQPIESSKATLEEQATFAAIRNFTPPTKIRANRILINGFRFPFANAKPGRSTPVAAGAIAGEGTFEPYFDTNGSERSPSGTPIANAYGQTYDPFAVVLSGSRATPTQEFPREGWVPRFPPRDSPLGQITVADVRQMVQQAANKARRTRAGIRNPKGTAEEVWICVTDLAGNICGSFRTEDATPFSFDVHVQKARTAAFFSNNTVGFGSRSVGFLAQTFYPPGVDKDPAGPISGLMNVSEAVDPGALGATPPEGSDRINQISQLIVDDNGPALPIVGGSVPATLQNAVQILARRLPHTRDGRLSPLQVGITVDLSLGRPTAAGFNATPTAIPNGITIFAGGVPIYKNGALVGGLGVSGGGIDQDDIIALAGQEGFDPPSGVRCDEAGDPAIIAALQEAVVKLKAQFPNLTNGSTAVLDVIDARLANGTKVLQDLRIPYVKLPREPNRR